MAPTLGILGMGRVGAALARALVAHGLPLVGLSSRQPELAQPLADELSVPLLAPAALLERAELVVLAVSDDAIASVAAELAPQAGAAIPQAVVHCSGALALEPLEPLAAAGWQVGAWHPLQAFATRAAALHPGITWGITAAEPLRSTLHALTHTLEGQPRDVAAADKPLYHAAAVLACNYAITLAAQAVAVLDSCGFSADDALSALLPLLSGNLAGLERVGLPAALTGPLARGDAGTITRHLELLDATHPDAAALYRACARATLPLLQQRGMASEQIDHLAKRIDS